MYCTVHKKTVCDIGGEHEIPQYLLVSKIVPILFPQSEEFSILNLFNGVWISHHTVNEIYTVLVNRAIICPD
jgi:hypothetical protein